MTEAVTSASMTVRVAIPNTDRSYELRAPTFGEVGNMAARAEGMMVPSDTIFAEIVREALMASDLPDEDKAKHSAALDAYFEAEDELRSAVAVLPDHEKRTDEQRAEIARLNRALRAADRGRAKAEWAVRDSKTVQEVKRQHGDASRNERAEIVALCLGCSLKEATALPAGDFLAIHEKAVALLKPTPAAEKN